MWLEGVAPGDFNAGFCVWRLVTPVGLAPGTTLVFPSMCWLGWAGGLGSMEIFFPLKNLLGSLEEDAFLDWGHLGSGVMRARGLSQPSWPILPQMSLWPFRKTPGWDA